MSSFNDYSDCAAAPFYEQADEGRFVFGNTGFTSGGRHERSGTFARVGFRHNCA